MIVSLRGRLREKSATLAWIEAAGVGYGLQISLSTFEALPRPGEEIELLTTMVVREDSQQLFGFATRDERRLFELLMTVSGVGPKVALAVLSGLRPEALTRSIRENDVGALTTVSGVGRKTAERILVDLRDKLGGEPPTSPGAAATPAGGVFEDAVGALVSLGFPRPAAVKAVQSVAENGGLPIEEWVRRALAAVGKAQARV
ncbi:MAG TPA: Holliday junction branch migration protein RuvA [Candidatus Eisenbacteria bacterium]|jgi:Holliday junction DNA helicase RuvA|nr:Holliday junction branch migration protein RuvA [Candidatus Eisenbacteria bacterium]